MAANSAELSKSAPPPIATPSKDPPPKTPVQAQPKEQPAVLLEISREKISPFGNIREVGAEDTRDLAADVKIRGVLEPLLLVPLKGYTAEQLAKFDPKKAGYEFRLVAGHRRFAAAGAAGLKTVPARIMSMSELEILEAQLAENLQRRALSPIEEAAGFRAYLAAPGAGSQEQLAKRLGFDRSYVSNRIRLLALPQPVRDLVDSGDLSSSHAEVLLKMPVADPGSITETAKAVVKRNVPVAVLNRSVTRHLEELEVARLFKEKISKAKFSSCPTCKKPATKDASWPQGFVCHGEGQFDAYSTSHTWSPATGKTAAEKEQAEHASYRSSSAASSKPRPKPVDCTEPASLRSAHDPMAIVQAFLKEIGPSGIRLVEYQRTGYSSATRVFGKAVLRIAVDDEPLGRAHVVLRPVKYASGERSQLVVQDTKGAERRTSKAAVQAWERKALPALKLKPAPARAADPKTLLGTNGDVIPRLQKLRGDPELLELTRALEAKGKHRAAVLDAIDELLLGRAHDSYAGYSGDRRL